MGFFEDAGNFVKRAAGNATGGGSANPLGAGGIFGGLLGGGSGGVAGGVGSFLGTENRFEAGTPQFPTQNFTARLGHAAANQDEVYRQQQSLAQQLLAQANGQGPNPAMAQLAQATGQNAALQGALMGSARGASRNPALLARQAAMQGANVQQQAAGQAATLAAQQQIAARQALAQQQAQMANQWLQSESINQGGFAAQNQNLISAQLGAQQMNANVAAQNQATRAGLIGGAMQGGGAMMGMMAHGGQVPGYADGGMAQYPAAPIPQIDPWSAKGNPYGESKMQSMHGKKGGATSIGSPSTGGSYATNMAMACGGSVPMPMMGGGHVPGVAPYAGDTTKNDVVPAMLSPGEVVIPRSIAQGPNMEAKVLEFMRHLKGKSGSSYGDVIQARKGKA